MYYLIVAEGDHEYVLCNGRREDLEKMARQLRAEGLFRYVRVDASAPPGVGKHSPPQLGDRIPEVGNQQH
jgi:hypothetical protein